MKSIIGEKIKELRKKAGITQLELAKELKISPSTVGMYEQGRREPDNNMVLRLCQIFNTTTDYLLGKSDKNREISDIIDEFTEVLSSQKGLMFDGTPLTEEDRSKIVDAIKVAAAIAQQQYKKSIGGI